MAGNADARESLRATAGDLDLSAGNVELGRRAGVFAKKVRLIQAR